MRFSWSACLVILAFTSSGCFLFNEEPTTEELENLFDNEPYETVVANFDPLNAVLPYPYNLLFAAGGNEPDGSLDIPVVDPTDFADPAVALNTLDGFSTIQPMTFTFSGIVDQSTIIAGDTVRVFEVELCCGQTNFLGAQRIIRELEAPSALFGTPGEYSLSMFVSESLSGEVIDGVKITPTVPLKPATGYLVSVTRNITDLNGVPIKWDLIYGVTKRKTPLVQENGDAVINYVGLLSDNDNAALLEQIRQLTASYEDALLPFGIMTDSVALSFAFTTQSTTNMVEKVVESMSAGDYTMGPVFDPATGAFQDSAQLGLPGATGESYVYLGTIEVPYYLDPNNPAGGKWMGYQSNWPTRIYEAVSGYGPEPMGSEVIPFAATIPKNCGPTPLEGWPVSIFVHTLSQNRLNLFAMGDHMAKQPYCTAGIAIDLALHGVDMYSYDANGIATDAFSETFLLSADAPQFFGPDANEDGVGDGLGAYQNYPWFYSVRDTVHERHFNMDYDGDGKPESATTGLQFFNPLSLLTTRDNIRQSVTDVVALAKTIPTMNDTWSGTLYGLSALTETLKIAPASAADCAEEISPSDICNFSPLPCCGSMREAYDGVMDLMGVAFLADQSVVAGSVGATVDALTLAGGPAVSLVTSFIEPVSGTVVPTSGLIYEASKAAAMYDLVATEYYESTNGFISTCGTDAPTTAQILGVVGATLDALRGGGANVSDGYINEVPGAVEAYQLPDMSSDDLAIGGAFENIAAAATGAEAVAAAEAYLASALTAIQTAILGTGNDDSLADLANAVASADDLIVTHMTGMGEKASALVPLVGGAYPALVGLTTGDNNVAPDVMNTLTATADTVAASAAAAEAIESSGASPAALALAAAAKEAEITAANAVVTGAVTAFSDAFAAYGAAAAAAPAAVQAFLASGCADLALAAEMAAASESVETTLLAGATAAGNVAGAVSVMAGLVANQEDTADMTTLVGLAGAAIVQVVGQGPDAGQPVGIGTAAGNAALGVSNAAAAITAATSTWRSSAPLFDSSKISSIGHSFGGSVAMMAAAVEPSIKQTVMVGAAGGLAYAFEYSGTLGQAIADGLAGVGAFPGNATWESFFSAFQAAMDPADPISYVDLLDPSQAVLAIEFEDDAFFPNSIADRPLGGSGPLINLMGLERITASTDSGAGGALRAAVRINADDAPVGFITFLDPTAGCAATDVACVEENDFYRSEMRDQTMSFIASGGQSVTINPIAPKYGSAIVEVAD